MERPRPRPNPFRNLLYVLMAIAMIAAACGGSDSGTASEEGGSTAADGDASGDGGAATAGIGPTTDLMEGTGGELVIGMTASNIPLLDTGLAQNEGYEGIRFVGNQLYDGLTRFDLSSEEGVPEVVPALAESWVVSEDLVTWTFTLREGVTFHDGTPWNADAAVFNLERYTAEDSPNFYPELAAQGGINVGGIDTVSKVDDMTIEITTVGPWSYLPIDLAAVFFGSPTAIQELGNEGFGEAPVGTGPFSFVELVRGERLVLDRNEDYWRGAPALERVILRPIPDSTARVAALQAGEVDWIEVPLPDDIPGLVDNGFQWASPN
jgi:peptide/nickel transport system substrate-binding protein